MDNALPITAFTAVACAALYLFLTAHTIRLRRRHGVPFGDGGHRDLMKSIRGHANAAEQVPVFLILLGLAEMNGAPFLLPLAVLFVVGRTLHALYFAWHGLHFRFRFFGMLATLIALGLAPLSLLIALLT